MLRRLIILLLLGGASVPASRAATVTNDVRVFTGGATVRSIFFRSLTSNQQIGGSLSVGETLSRTIVSNNISVEIDQGVYDYWFAGMTRVNRCVVPPGSGTYSLVSLTTNLTVFSHSNPFLGYISAHFLPGTNIVLVTNNAGMPNETLTIHGTATGSSEGGAALTNTETRDIEFHGDVTFGGDKLYLTNSAGPGYASPTGYLAIAPDGVIYIETDGSALTTLNGSSISSGTVADARIHADLARDSEVTSAIAALFTVYQPLDADLDDLADGSLTGSKIGSGINGDNVTSGTVAEARIDSTMARDSEVTSAISALSSVYQPLDSDLTSIAALTTTAFGRGLLDDADATAGRASLSLVIGTDVQAWDADLDDLADGSLSGSKVGSGIDAANITTGTLPGARYGAPTAPSVSGPYVTTNGSGTSVLSFNAGGLTNLNQFAFTTNRYSFHPGNTANGNANSITDSTPDETGNSIWYSATNGSNPRMHAWYLAAGANRFVWGFVPNERTLGRTNCAITARFMTTNVSYFGYSLTANVMDRQSVSNSLVSGNGFASNDGTTLSVIRAGTNIISVSRVFAVKPNLTNAVWEFAMGVGATVNSTNSVFFIDADADFY